MLYDPVIAHLIKKEELRQAEEICLIASENYVSADVQEAQGSVLTNKYAEGFPGKRYYGGCNVVDEIEQLAIDRAKELFDCDYVNVQPHSGSQANAAVYSALLRNNDTILGMKLSDGGHLTHGSPVNFSGKNYEFVSYGLNDDGMIDYEEVARLASECQPELIVVGYSAYSRVIDFKRFREIANDVGAYLMVDMAHFAGFVAAGLMESPLEHADVVTTTTHKTLRGPRGGMILSKGQPEEFYKKLNSSVFPGTQGGPLMHVIAAKAVALKEANTSEYRFYMFDVRSHASMSAEIFIDRGFNVVSGGTENHMFLVDLSDKEYTGKQAEEWLSRAGIIVNKNSVPNDARSPFQTSGIRIGLAAVTTRGLDSYHISRIMGLAADVLESQGDDVVIEEARKEIINIALNFAK
ncbi:MAG: serine hydroxymethyltransferase [Bacilli bacterium]